MKRILIIGCSGSGKTTLAQALGEKLELPVISLDGLWSGNATKAEFDSRLERALSLESWIMDGNYGRTMAQHAQRLVLKSRKEVRDFLNTI